MLLIFGFFASEILRVPNGAGTDVLTFFPVDDILDSACWALNILFSCRETMTKKLLLFFTALLLFSCSSSGSVSSGSAPQEDSPFWLTLPRSDALVIIGVSGRQLKKETEIAVAKEEAARRVSMYNGLYASFEAAQNSGSGFLDYSYASESRVDYDEQLDKYIERLNYDPERDVIDTEDGLFIRFTYPSSFPGRISYKFGNNPDGSPEWTARPPQEMDGYMVGVGFSRRQARWRDTFTKSCEAAIIAMVSQTSSSVEAGDSVYNNQSSTFFYQKSEGRLSQFLVLEVWIDPNNQSVWTLAVAKKG